MQLRCFRLRTLFAFTLGVFCIYLAIWVIHHTTITHNHDFTDRLSKSLANLEKFIPHIEIHHNESTDPRATVDHILALLKQSTTNVNGHNDEPTILTSTHPIEKSLNESSHRNYQPTIPSSLPPVSNKYEEVTTLENISWSEFIKIQKLPFHNNNEVVSWSNNINSLNRCTQNIAANLSGPLISRADFEWCQWAMNSGGVRPGKSWGILKTHQERGRFDQLNCNAVAAGKNPSCDDSWGDAYIKDWRQHVVSSMSCQNKTINKAIKHSDSQVNCKVDDAGNTYCYLQNAIVNFKKRLPHAGPQTVPFSRSFISAHCIDGKTEILPMHDVYSPTPSTTHCDVVLNETVILVSHEHIFNLAHTMNDVMNLWLVMWLEGIAQHSKQISLLNVDRLRYAHDFNDSFSPFFDIYKRSFRNIYRGRDFGEKSVCIKELLVPSRPAKFFVFDGWVIDMPCSFMGPSSLFQRWNVQVRESFQLLPGQAKQPDESLFQVLLLIRNTTFNNWKGQRTSRNFLNTAEIVKATEQLLQSLPTVGSTDPSHRIKRFKLVALDVSDLNFTEQVELVSQSSLLVGMHGAGISLSLFMSIGLPHCCGVLELFPEGEHKRIRGFGNMARRMGVRYDRLDIDPSASTVDGAHVPVHHLRNKISTLITRLTDVNSKSANSSSLLGPSCVHPALFDTPIL